VGNVRYLWTIAIIVLENWTHNSQFISPQHIKLKNESIGTDTCHGASCCLLDNDCVIKKS